jgi:hypothetical protein
VITWTRARIDTLCGCCQRRILVDEVMALVRVMGLQRLLTRCQGCASAFADGQVPADLEQGLREPGCDDE